MKRGATASLDRFVTRKEVKQSTIRESLQTATVSVASEAQPRSSGVSVSNEDENGGVTAQQKERIELHKRRALALRALNHPEEANAHSSAAVADLLTEPSWRDALRGTIDGPPGQKVTRLLQDEIAAGATVYPPQKEIFRAFNETPLPNVKAVIVGQDPYHGEGQAEGFSFSVPEGVKVPSSLKNILREVGDDFGYGMPRSGHLGKWARQGVLLLNAVLTVQAGRPRSHSKQGWEAITTQAIRELSRRREGVVFLLWGKDAQTKKQSIDTSKHLVLESAHPSGLSAHKGFFGCKHFSRTNAFLVSTGQSPIDWRLDVDHNDENAQSR